MEIQTLPAEGIVAVHLPPMSSVQHVMDIVKHLTEAKRKQDSKATFLVLSPGTTIEELTDESLASIGLQRIAEAAC